MDPINISAHKKRKEEQRSPQTKDPDLGEGGGKSMYVLAPMFLTAPTFQAEMFALKELLPLKTCDISVTKDVSQSSIGPYLAMVAAVVVEFKYSFTASLIPEVRAV